MNVKQLIEALSKLPQDMPVGTTNYYNIFGPVTSVEIEKAHVQSWDKDLAHFEGKDVVMISFKLDLQ